MAAFVHDIVKCLGSQIALELVGARSLRIFLDGVRAVAPAGSFFHDELWLVCFGSR